VTLCLQAITIKHNRSEIAVATHFVLDIAVATHFVLDDCHSLPGSKDAAANRPQTGKEWSRCAWTKAGPQPVVKWRARFFDVSCKLPYTSLRLSLPESDDGRERED
jgi:hypothetical protein